MQRLTILKRQFHTDEYLASLDKCGARFDGKECGWEEAAGRHQLSHDEGEICFCHGKRDRSTCHVFVSSRGKTAKAIPEAGSASRTARETAQSQNGETK